MKIKLSLLIALPLVILIGCTKDRVVDPNTLNLPQSIIYVEHFDGTSLPDLPTGWFSAPDTAWVSDSTNSSVNYTGASGLRNIVISNDTDVSGNFSLYSKAVSSTGFNKLSVMYGGRRSKHFSDNGSSMSLAYSIDGGISWKVIPYSENTNDSNWYPINGSVRITLPEETSNQASIQFRWTANLVPTASGSYRIDDFQLFGNQM